MKAFVTKRRGLYDIIEGMTKDLWYENNKIEINNRRRERYKIDSEYKRKAIANVTQYRIKNPDKVKANKVAYRENNRDKHRAWTNNFSKRRISHIYKELGNECSRCGFTDLRAIQIHHTYGKERKLDWMKLDYDLSLLELLCANCHSIHHYQNNHRKV